MRLESACPDHCHNAGADCREQFGSGVDDGRPFPLGFRLPLIFHVLSSMWLSPPSMNSNRRSLQLSPIPNERRRSPRLQTLPNLADLEWRDRLQTRSSQGNILNISDHGALVFSDSFPSRSPV